MKSQSKIYLLSIVNKNILNQIREKSRYKKLWRTILLPKVRLKYKYSIFELLLTSYKVRKHKNLSSISKKNIINLYRAVYGGVRNSVTMPALIFHKLKSFVLSKTNRWFNGGALKSSAWNKEVLSKVKIVKLVNSKFDNINKRGGTFLHLLKTSLERIAVLNLFFKRQRNSRRVNSKPLFEIIAKHGVKLEYGIYKINEVLYKNAVKKIKLTKLGFARYFSIKCFDKHLKRIDSKLSRYKYEYAEALSKISGEKKRGLKYSNFIRRDLRNLMLSPDEPKKNMFSISKFKLIVSRCVDTNFNKNYNFGKTKKNQYQKDCRNMNEFRKNFFNNKDGLGVFSKRKVRQYLSGLISEAIHHSMSHNDKNRFNYYEKKNRFIRIGSESIVSKLQLYTNKKSKIENSQINYVHNDKHDKNSILNLIKTTIANNNNKEFNDNRSEQNVLNIINTQSKQILSLRDELIFLFKNHTKLNKNQCTIQTEPYLFY
ncbi:hypothetical protein KCM76_16230 [Zooshikella marina]|uniref:hypothetical protein n=1 Tax=Zooshikella ganghwensis TaxID=202772 RepID=UPI001BAEA063|nr:hypothetical protein [Zooshikella ganghwensis]MBU2707543.1 hypothetical protein [Zooshikella ganghwensis]